MQIPTTTPTWWATARMMWEMEASKWSTSQSSSTARRPSTTTVQRPNTNLCQATLQRSSSKAAAAATTAARRPPAHPAVVGPAGMVPMVEVGGISPMKPANCISWPKHG